MQAYYSLQTPEELMEPNVSTQIIEGKILFIRYRRVMLDADLAALYGVETKVLNQAVKRNMRRFPTDFMFQLSREEAAELSRSQFVTLKRGQNVKYLPYAFTENGVAMLSSVLNSERAITVNIQIMRTFTKLREMLAAHKDLQKKVDDMERKFDHQFKVVFDAIRQLLEQPETKRKKIGFLVKERRVVYGPARR